MDSLDLATLTNVNEKGFVPDEVRNAFFRKLRIKSENRSCFECTARNPTWISLSYGIYLCLECSGEHRRKGVHISFVRSVELDSFTPEQMLQMGVGGNSKAWEYFKGHGMGKLSDAGRAIDYNSGITKRYKALIEKDTHEACEKMGLHSSKGPPAPGGLEKSTSAPATDELTDFVQEAKAGGPGAPSQLTRGKSAPASAHTNGYPGASSAALGAASAQPKAMPPQPKAAGVAPKARAPPPAIHSVAVDCVVSRVVSPTSNASKVTSSSNAPKPSGFAAKQKAKEIDFDFDFDDLEREASKPPPAQVPKASSASEPMSTPPTSRAQTSCTAAAASSNEIGDMMSKYGGKKGISSDDFFHQEDQESAQARMERENRYHKFAASGAISSSAFFEDGDQKESGLGGSNSGEGFEDFKSMATQGSQLARAGLSKGAELLSSYLNKGRN